MTGHVVQVKRRWDQRGQWYAYCLGFECSWRVEGCGEQVTRQRALVHEQATR